jgi:hypothetical protein
MPLEANRGALCEVPRPAFSAAGALEAPVTGTRIRDLPITPETLP